MKNFILRRLLQTLPMLLLASFIIFMLFAKTPGDFIDGNITLTAARAAELKAIYGLDQPLFTRYLHWLGQLLRGDLGFSLQYQIPVSQLLNQYIWNSFLLASVALVFYWGIGLAVGVVSALRPGSWFDHLVSVAVFAAMSFPTFFLCLLLIKWFAVDLHWLPVGGMTNTGSDESGWQYVLQVAAHLALPVLALVGLFFTVSLMSGISTVAGAEAMSAVDAAQSGTASALMGTLMFVFGGIAAPLAGLGGETMLKMSLAMAICYLLALLLGLSKPRSAR